MNEKIRHKLDNFYYSIEVWSALFLLTLTSCTTVAEASNSFQTTNTPEPTPTMATWLEPTDIFTSTPEPTFATSLPLFPSTDYSTSTPIPEIEVVLGGDMMLGREVLLTSRITDDFDILDGIEPALGDINILNLESPFKENCIQDRDPSNLCFCADPEFLTELSNIHIGK